MTTLLMTHRFRVMKSELQFNIVVFLFIVIYLYAAISKLLIFEGYQLQMNKQPLPDELTLFLTVLIPAVEIALSALLLIPKTRYAGLLLSTAAMIFFTGYIIMILARYFGEIPCACGGLIGSLSWEQHLILNITYVALGFYGLLLGCKRNDNDTRRTVS